MNDEMLRAYDSTLAFHAFLIMHPESLEVYRQLHGDDISPALWKVCETFQSDQQPAPVLDVIEKAYRQLRYLAAPGGNWN